MGTILEVREMNGIPVLVVAGKLDHQCGVAIKNIMSSWLEQGKYRIVLDLGEAEGICYVVLSILVGMVRILRNFSGDMKIARLRFNMREIFQRIRIDGLFECFDTAEEAAGSFSERRTQHPLQITWGAGSGRVSA